MKGKLIPVFVLAALVSCSQPPVKEQGPRPVKLADVTSLNMVEKSFSGVVSPDQFSDLAFKMSGPLISLNVDEGQKVRTGQIVAEINEAGMSFGTKHVFSGANFIIEKGDKIALVGRNGEGKSTMVKAIMGQIDFEGEIRIGYNVRIGYFAQNEASGLDESITVFKTVDDIAVGDIRTRIRDILGAFMFGKEASEKLVKVLSGGERTRLAMIKLLLEPVNLLILDEPTNHLDLKTKEILKEALMAFDGTLIVVSHDRDFLDGLTSKIYEFSHGRVTEHLDGVYGFLRKKKIENISEIERRKA